MAPGLAGCLREGSAPKREEGKNQQPVFVFHFSLSAEGVLPKDRVSLFPSRWLAVAASERKRVMFTGIPKEKTFDVLRQQAFLEKRSFASKDGWGTSSGRLGATPMGPGGETARFKKSL